MSGIVSLVYGRDIPDMGKKAELLLKGIKYLENDSTGAAILCVNKSLTLFKNLGGPEMLCRNHPVCIQAGQRFVGFNSSATSCLANGINCQPHRVECRTALVGALIGTITNCGSLATWLLQRDHIVVSASEAEIFIHLVEDHYATSARLSSSDLARMRQAYAYSGQRECMPDSVLRMIYSIRKADALMEGSYSAVIADPGLPGLFAMRSGESLSVARNKDEWGDYTIVVSDQSSVLTETDKPESLTDGEGIWCTEKSLVSFSLRGIHAFPKLGAPIEVRIQPL